MFKFVMLALAILQMEIGDGQLKVPKEPNVLTPPYFNIATGKKIESTATCGEDGAQVFCKLTGGPNEYGYNDNLYQGQFCDACDSTDPTKSHPINYAIDGTEKWWQSPPLSQGSEYNKINITLHLGQVFHVAYTIIKFANSPRAGTWVLERSSDHGKTFQPWQYFANSNSDCHNLFGIDAFEEISSDDSVICTSEYSDVVPLERGEVIVSMINSRPGAKNFSHSPVLQEWTKATDVRLRLLRTKTLLGHLMAVQRQDPTVTRRYFYSIKDISIGGRCVCNGHADTCEPDPENKYKLKCQCRHNTCGDSCEYCCPGFVQKAWRAAVPESSNECQACNCHGHTNDCVYDEDVAIRRLSIDLFGNYEGGGVCQNCSHNTTGINCETCVDGYYRPGNVDPRDPNGCRPCECDSAFTVGTCEPVTGRCYCQPEYAGDRCDRCAPGYHNFPECEPCPCFYDATRGGVCLPVDDVCPCKYNFAGMYCTECAAGFYNFPDCKPCTCHGKGAVSEYCDQYTGQCDCDAGFGGLYCDECTPGYFNYPVCQSCACLTAFTTTEVCNAETGECLCKELVTGELCNQCTPGYYNFPSCQECDCSAFGSMGDLCDAEFGKCECKPNYQGDKCDECAPEYYDYPNCIPCDCDVQGSLRTTCDVETGQCSCYGYIAGRRCEKCAPDYFNFPRCEDCKCDPRGIKAVVPGVCLAFTAGQCDCKENVVGVYCDMCDSLHHNLTLGCIDCNCLLQGTLDGVASCNSESGGCWCKPYTHTQKCSQCQGGFFDLEEANYFGCSGCQCDAGGAVTQDCDTVDGQCRCKRGVTGRRCNRVEPGHYYPNLLQHHYEVEDGKSTTGDILRFGFDPQEFPGFSMKGYGEFSTVQSEIIVPVVIENHGLYRLFFYYVQPYGSSRVNVTLHPVSAEGSEQRFEALFEVSVDPKLIAANEVLVLNRGQWDVAIEASPGLLVDYFVLLPSEYYEPSILQAKVTEPCKSTTDGDGKECVMYTHAPLTHTPNVTLTDLVDEDRHGSPSLAHPVMVLLEGNALGDGRRGMVVNIAPESAGKYVVVVEYASTADRLQTIEATVSDGRLFPNAKFNIYSCDYAFLCRQVALTTLNDVMVFDLSLPNIRVDMSVGALESVYVKRLYAVPYEKWTMEYIEPKRLCVTKEGSTFDSCIAWEYPVPETGRIFEAGAGDGTDAPVPTATDGNVKAKFLDSNRTMKIEMDLVPGRYVFLLHYYNPYHLSFTPSIVIMGGVIHVGGANVTHCPSGDGCRAVVTSDSGAVALDITSPTQTMTINVPQGKSFWLDYVLAIPEDAYKISHLDLMQYDHSRKFFEECYGIGSEGLIDLAKEPSEFCRDAVFSLTMDFNDGALTCECSDGGTHGGKDVDCKTHGGQCPCRPNVIGRRCDRCAIGFHSFPKCVKCDCNGTLCDEVNGNCVCPPNTAPPDCSQCVPFTHSFHSFAGCVECDCNLRGVVDAADLACNNETGQCRCKENVEGQRCDRCKPGFFSFPECRPCVCDQRGRLSEGCDSLNGQCLCKDNVEGQQCDRCKAGTFYLDGNNPLGCTRCFCFGVSGECSSTLYPATEVIKMDGWRLLNLKTSAPGIQRYGHTVEIDVLENGGAVDPSRANLYWAAPGAYLNDQLGSYGGDLEYTVESRRRESGGRGDNAGDYDYTFNGEPAPIVASAPSVILEGNGMVIGHTSRVPVNGYSKARLTLLESNFVHQASGNPVKREEMMMILSPLSALRIRASGDPQAAVVSISDVSLTTTDYSSPLASGRAIATVEECICPKGYSGESCQICSQGHYREGRGPYLGYCAECDCYGHCDHCNKSGGLLSKDDCLHNTTGDNCERCQDGYVGDATSRHRDACQQCPCPFPNAEGNFAKTCEYDEGILVCNCEPGYTGERCEQCDIGFFGNPAVIGGKCQTCNCHGNLDLGSSLEVCNRVTGECSDCKYNTGGKYCQNCADGYYGDATVARNCTRCPCYECGTLQCDHIYGYCACKAHVIGDNCDQCQPGYFDLNSCTGCHDCGCAGGAVGRECNEVTGQCDCAPNVVGLKCDKCAQGHWDYSTRGCKPCNCHNDGDCNPVNGYCECPPGITGRQCDKCELERHVLPAGGSLCEPCDECTHNLLNMVERLTAQTQGITEEVLKVSFGFVAAHRLEKLVKRMYQNRVMMSDTNLHMDYLNGDGEILLSAGKITSDNMEEISGSGGFDGSGVFGFLEQNKVDTFSLILTSLKAAENAVAAMCNHTEAMVEAVEKTASRTTMLNAESAPTENEINQLEKKSIDLLQQFDEESSGDGEEYFEKLNKGKMLLERMKMRTLDHMKDLSDAELKEAETIFGLVDEKYVSPSNNMKQGTGNVSQDLDVKLQKLNKLRTRLNGVISTVTEVTALNNFNKKELEMSRGVLQRTKTIYEDIEKVKVDSGIKVHKRGNDSKLDVVPGDALKEVIHNLQAAYDLHAEASYGKENLLNMSIDKATMLKEHAKMMIRIIQETSNDSRTVTAIQGANRYGWIVYNMENAKVHAYRADLDATEAHDAVFLEKLPSKAEKAHNESSELLSSQGRSQILLGNLQNTLSANTDDQLKQLTIDLTDRLSGIVDEVLDLDNEHVDEKVTDTREMSGEADETAEEVLGVVELLENRINESPDPNIALNDQLTAVEDTLEGVTTKIEDANSQLGRLKNQALRLARLKDDLFLDDKIKKIRKLIDLSRSRADTVTVSMKFKSASNGDIPEYVQPRLLPKMLSAEDFANVELYVNVSKSPNNSILFWGDVSSTDGDYMSLETIEGRVHYRYKVGEGTGELVGTRPINDNQWHRISIRRFGSKGRLEIEYPGDIFGDEEDNVVPVEGEVDGDNIKATLPVESSAFVIGGMPFPTLPLAIQNRQMSGCVKSVSINGEQVGTWNFISYNGPEPGENCQRGPSTPRRSYNRMWKFRGGDSYLRVTSKQLERERFYVNPSTSSFIFRFKFSTMQSNALLFLIGETADQFFSLELRNGKFVLTCNFGWDEPRQGIVQNFPDVNAHGQPLSIKAGLVTIRNNIRMVVLAINTGLNLNMTFTRWAPNIKGDAWVGGIHSYNVPDELRPHILTIDEHFRGCLGGMAFHFRTSFDIYSAYERVGVTPGCQPELITSIEVDGDDFISVPTGLLNTEQISGLVTARTVNPDGTIIVAREHEVNGDRVSLSMANGNIVLSDGEMEMRSRKTYDDGQPHTIKFERYIDGSLYLNVDDSEIKTMEAFEDTEDARRRRKRRLRRKRPKQSSAKATLFSLSPVHVYVGGSPDDVMFNGCIANILLEGDSKHPGLLTENARCGYSGNIKCSGKPLFNKCTLDSSSDVITTSLLSVASKPDMKLGEISAHEFTNGMTLNGDGVNGHNGTILGEVSRKKKGKRRGGKNKKKSGNRGQDTILGIDAIQLHDTGYDANCQLPLNPETSGFYYPGDGYSAYSLDDFDSSDWRFSLKIRTDAKEGIIFFMCTSGCPEHVAVYLIKGKIVVSVKFGTERKRIKSERRYNDGQWHDVTFQRKAQNLQLIVDHTISHMEFFEISQTSSKLMLFYVGGLQAMEKKTAESFMSLVHLSDFTGCIQSLVVNDQAIAFSTSARLHFKINLRPCFEGDTETGMFFSNTDPSEDGAFMTVYNVYNVGTNLEITMEIRPRAQSGVLLAVGGFTGNFFHLLLVDGKVVARMRQESDILMAVYDPGEEEDPICDGKWHKIKVIKAKNILTLSVDGNLMPIERGNIDIRECETDGPLYLGGIPRDANVGKLLTDRRQYTGCMKNVLVDYFPITASIAIEVKSGVSKNSCPLY